MAEKLRPPHEACSAFCRDQGTKSLRGVSDAFLRTLASEVQGPQPQRYLPYHLIWSKRAQVSRPSAVVDHWRSRRAVWRLAPGSCIVADKVAKISRYNRSGAIATKSFVTNQSFGRPCTYNAGKGVVLRLAPRPDIESCRKSQSSRVASLAWRDSRRGLCSRAGDLFSLWPQPSLPT